MRAVPESRIASDGVAVLKPGSMHLMLMQPRAPPKAGHRGVVAFAMSNGERFLDEFELRRPALQQVALDLVYRPCNNFAANGAKAR